MANDVVDVNDLWAPDVDAELPEDRHQDLGECLKAALRVVDVGDAQGGLAQHVRAVIGFVVEVMRTYADQISGERSDRRSS